MVYEQAKNKAKETVFEFVDIEDIDWGYIEVYDTLEDATVIWVCKLTNEEEAVKGNFKNPFV